MIQRKRNQGRGG